MKIQCSDCGEDLEEPGALVFSPPDKADYCQKLHLCVDCWEDLHREVFDQ